MSEHPDRPLYDQDRYLIVVANPEAELLARSRFYRGVAYVGAAGYAVAITALASVFVLFVLGILWFTFLDVFGIG